VHNLTPVTTTTPNTNATGFTVRPADFFGG